ncbi:mannose-1-phosphate guanylyltransferase/mannose-6-phosphate isomerase [Taklimakanibacter deserti]|uniref:mannose-1-phosphate guanylyltransferase/mannose-6-phosphate isomerase n=1 Tax=Taklimakanibacter deserti TaxID=2267839 RepID=UPI003F683092
MIIPLIICGGSGTRLWPASREDRPKQFLDLFETLSTFQETVRRTSDPAVFGSPVIITNGKYCSQVREQLGELDTSADIVLEPEARDSGPAILAGTLFIAQERGSDAIVLTLAADHVIRDVAAFQAACRAALAAAKSGHIVTFGVAPDHPATGYGYIEAGRAIEGGVHVVTRFVEKPDVVAATRYIQRGYLWNSGNFLFQASALADAYGESDPATLAAVRAAVSKAKSNGHEHHLDAPAFARAAKLSFDYAVMERTSRAAVMPASFDWSDVGSWAAVRELSPRDEAGNAAKGEAVFARARDNIVSSDGPLIALAGVSDLAVVATDDAVLVARRDDAAGVKMLVEQLKKSHAPLTRSHARPTTGTFPGPTADTTFDEALLETAPLIKATGFREYDARWWFGHPHADKAPELNLMGVQALGMGLGTLLGRQGVAREVVTGHDYRSYSGAIKQALITGLMAAGCRVHDIGLALSPMAYFAQFALDVPAVAMVTASHNDNGWTGVKMGCDRPVTFGPQEMAELKNIVLSGAYDLRGGGSYVFHSSFGERYIADLTDRPKLKRPLKVVAACGNGTAGIFAPRILTALGCEVVPLDCDLDHNFPRYNPNPEDLKMLHAMADAVRATGADIALGFDGDGDRCGIVDNEGHEIFADKIGVMLARDLSTLHPDARFVVDVKSTGLYESDPVLKGRSVKTDYWKTGHSYIKRRVRDLKALAGFEKSGHFFFNAPIGRGYDDGLVTAIAVIEMLDRNPQASMADLYRGLPHTWGSPTMSPHCADEVKYDVVDRITARLRDMHTAGATMAGKPITGLTTVNGVRISIADGSWGLVRASSNKPELVVVVESPASEAQLRAMFADLDSVIREHAEVGAYNQTLT